MSISLNVEGFTGKNSPEFQKHFKAVLFCIENDLSFPKETSEFFRGDDCFYRKIIVKRDTNVTPVTGSWSIPSRGVPETKIKISTKIKNWFRFNVAWRFYRYPPED